MSNEILRVKKRGRPKVESEEVSVRIQQPMLGAVDRFMEDRGLKGRPEAIRRLIEKGLETK